MKNKTLKQALDAATRSPREQGMVEAFHAACDLPIGDYAEPKIKHGKLRINLILEEANEFKDAVEAGDLIEAIDALADIMVVTLGAASTFGVDLGPFFDEVMRTNMLKAGGPRRKSDGKLLKPKGWKGPEIRRVLGDQVIRERRRKKLARGKR